MKKQKFIKLLVTIYALASGILFFIYQTTRIFRPEATEAEMIVAPTGLFDWGFVWADSLIIIPLMITGGIFLLVRNLKLLRLGYLFVFTGFTLNLYGILFFFVGLAAVGEPVSGWDLWFNVVFTLLGLACMFYCARKVMSG